MKRFILLFTLLVISSSTSAGYITPTFYWQRGTTAKFASLQAACDQWLVDFVAASPGYTYQNYSVVQSTDLAGSCKATWYNSNGVSQGNFSQPASLYASCQTGYTLVDLGGTTRARYQCSGSCPAGSVLNPTTNNCDDTCAQYKGQVVSFTVNCSANDAPSSLCMPNNCAATVSNSATGYDKVKSCYFGGGDAKYTGSTCSGQTSSASLNNPTSTQPPPADSPETDCLKSGNTFGTVNGVTVCVPKGSSSGAPTKTTDSSTTTTTTKDANGNTKSTGTSATTTELSQDGSAVVTKETKTNPDGSSTITETQTSKDNFCEKNPNNSICKKSDDTPSSCEDNPNSPQCMDVGEPDENPVLGESTRTVTFTPVSITAGGGCPSDKSVSIAGRSITFSYSWLCQYASMFKPFMLAFAYLSAAMFLFWGYKGAQT